MWDRKTDEVFMNIKTKCDAFLDHAGAIGRRYRRLDGYERDDEKPNAWRYRDYVIDAFNNDKPYDRFILEQLAGDELIAEAFNTDRPFVQGGDEGRAGAPRRLPLQRGRARRQARYGAKLAHPRRTPRTRRPVPSR